MWGFSASIRLGGAGPIWAGVRLYTLYGGCPGTDASNDIVPVLGIGASVSDANKSITTPLQTRPPTLPQKALLQKKGIKQPTNTSGGSCRSSYCVKGCATRTTRPNLSLGAATRAAATTRTMRALFLLATAATAFQPKTTQKPTTKLQAKVGDALGAGRQRFCCGLAPLDPPAPGTEFMHPLLLSGAAKTLREAGAAAIVVDDPVACDAVAGDLEAAGSEAVVLYAGDDAPASADARLVEGGEGGAGIVPVVEGLASAADVGAAAQAAADKGSEALVLRGGDVEVIGPLADTAVPVLRELPFATTTNVDDLDTDAFACKTLGYAGVLLSSQSQSPVGALSEALVNALGVLRSKRSRTYGGAWSESSGRVSESGDQAEAMKWARYMETTTKAGIVGAMEGGAGEDDEPLDEERGDYKAFDGPPAAGSTEKRPASTGPNVPGNEDARQASLKKLKDRGWNT